MLHCNIYTYLYVHAHVLFYMYICITCSPQTSTSNTIFPACRANCAFTTQVIFGGVTQIEILLLHASTCFSRVDVNKHSKRLANHPKHQTRIPGKPQSTVQNASLCGHDPALSTLADMMKACLKGCAQTNSCGCNFEAKSSAHQKICKSLFMH